jgi:hypothetical protein
MLYRIQTEDINRDSIIAIMSQNFESFTIIPAIGYWRGKPENSIIIEIIGNPDDYTKIRNCADNIRKQNKQECVLITQSQTRFEFRYRDSEKQNGYIYGIGQIV